MSRNQPEAVKINGQPLQCPYCGHDRFFRRTAQLNTAVSTFFGFDWLNQSATCYVCEQCGHIDWFLPR